MPSQKHAICDICNREMKPAGACAIAIERMGDGTTLRRIPHHGPGTCGDCNVRPGAMHHMGCDQEECPKCGGQALGCDCYFTPEQIKQFMAEMAGPLEEYKGDTNDRDPSAPATSGS